MAELCHWRKVKMQHNRENVVWPVFHKTYVMIDFHHFVQKKNKLDSSKLCETQIEKCKVWDYDADTLPGSYPHRKYMVCMVRNII